MDAEVSTHPFLTMIIEESVCLMSCEPIVFAIILITITRNILFFSSTEHCTPRKISNLVSRAYHLHYCTGKQNYLCQIFCDLLLKSVFERIFNVMRLILVKIKWHIKWKYLIQKFHYICLSYYFKDYNRVYPCS
jgi:hypothetical protein